MHAHQLLQSQNHMTLATADGAGTPWVSPVFFVQGERLSVYWVSSRTARHSDNIRHRSEVAIVVFVTQPQVEAVYLEASAEELEEESEIKLAIDLLQQKPQPDKFTVKEVSDVVGDAAWRIYKATPHAAYLRADDTENGQAVTVRIAVPIP
jgi:nitroimidazol reductase NimA-like FMN-containing flavoprotein (pyridoxamine 5'-phosphate oxidase superfamily)